MPTEELSEDTSREASVESSQPGSPQVLNVIDATKKAAAAVPQLQMSAAWKSPMLYGEGSRVSTRPFGGFSGY